MSNYFLFLDFDVFEMHEAMATQMAGNLNCLDSEKYCKDILGRSDGGKYGSIPIEKLNAKGGSLALGK